MFTNHEQIKKMNKNSEYGTAACNMSRKHADR